jgi:hypothetical protein
MAVAGCCDHCIIDMPVSSLSLASCHMVLGRALLVACSCTFQVAAEAERQAASEKRLAARDEALDAASQERDQLRERCAALEELSTSQQRLSDELESARAAAVRISLSMLCMPSTDAAAHAERSVSMRVTCLGVILSDASCQPRALSGAIVSCQVQCRHSTWNSSRHMLPCSGGIRRPKYT